MKPKYVALRALLLGSHQEKRSGDMETQRKVKIDGQRKRKGEIRGYKVKSLPPQRESAGPDVTISSRARFTHAA